MKKLLHRAALNAELVLDRAFGGTGKSRVIDPYLGYATPDALVLRGRVLSRLNGRAAQEGQGRLTNLRSMIGLFVTDEVAGATVHAKGVQAKTDEEGYFTLTLPKPDTHGWHQVPVHIEGFEDTTLCEALVPHADARFLVISDIDDTVLKTGAYQLWRNLWTSLTGNALTRQVFPDAVALMTRLSDGGRNPIFYVSSSPWNFHSFLAQIFKRTGLVRGPKFLRDLGLSENQFITGTHGDHKGGSIDTILSAQPGLPVILIGDTGQHDAEVYLDAARRHPDRIKAVVLREPGPGPDAKMRHAMGEIEASGVTLYHGTDFSGMTPDAELA